jgi:hypothetical protein
MDCPDNFGSSTTCTKYDTDIFKHIVVISKPIAVFKKSTEEVDAKYSTLLCNMCVMVAKGR